MLLFFILWLPNNIRRIQICQPQFITQTAWLLSLLKDIQKRTNPTSVYVAQQT
jgi:hypothetical protein